MFRRPLTTAFLLTALCGAGCVPTPPTFTPPKGTPFTTPKSGKQPQAKATNPAPTQTTAPPKTNTTRPVYRSGSPPLVRVRVSSSVSYLNEADADEDAIATAADVIERKLAELDPPVAYRPTPNEVRNEFVRQDTRSVQPPDAKEKKELESREIETNRWYVTYDVEISAEQVRNLRTRDRVGDGLRVLGVLTAAALAGFLFLRLDERTKGYLTRWLAVGAVALALGAAVTLYLL